MANELTESYEQVKGQRYRALVDKISRKWQQFSFKTAAEDVYFSDNESETLTSIVGVAYKTILRTGDTECTIIATGGLTPDNKIDVYTDMYGLTPYKIVIDDLANTVTLTFTPQVEDVTVKVVVGAFVEAAQ